MPRWIVLALVLLLAGLATAHVEDGSTDMPDAPPPPADDRYDGLPWWSNWEGAPWYGTVSQLHGTTAILHHLRADGDWIVWEENSDVLALHVPTGYKFNVTSDLKQQTRPSIHENRVVYEEWTNGTTDVWIYDLDTNTPRRLSFSPDNERSPEIRGSWIVWLDDRQGDWSVWAHNLDNGTEMPVSISNAKKQDIVVLDGGIVAWREIEFNQWDIYVRKLPDGKVKALTRDRTLEHPPQTDGRYLYFVKIPAGSSENALHRWDPETGEILSLGKKGVSTSPAAFLDGGVEIALSPSAAGFNTFYAVNRSSDRLTIVSPRFPASQPTWSGSTLFLVGRNETDNVVLMATVSPFAVQAPPTLKFVRPLDGGVVTGDFNAAGTYRGGGAWPEPTRLEWRVAGPGVSTGWAAVPAGETAPNWTAPVDLPELTDRAAFRLHIRAVYDNAPPVSENVGLSFRALSGSRVSLEGTVDLSVATFVAKNPGMILLLALSFVFLALVVARWRLRRVPRGAVRVEYVRPDE